MTRIKDVETALLKFEEAAIKYTAATEQGDYKTGNKNYAIIAKSITFLKEHESVETLSKFLNHNSVGVRMWSATYLLPFLEAEGLQTLEQIALETGIHSLTAKTTISEWEKGNLRL